MSLSTKKEWKNYHSFKRHLYNEKTHKDLSKIATEHSILSNNKGDYLKSIGFSKELLEEIRAEFATPTPDSISAVCRLGTSSWSSTAIGWTSITAGSN